MPDIAKRQRIKILNALWGLAMLYAFLLSIEALGAAFNMMGKGFAEQLMATTANPVLGLFIGLLVTSIIQSSSCTTSIVVTLVSAMIPGTALPFLPIRNAVPIIMGANIGTTVTNTLVSLGQMGRKDEFRRAMSAALVHDTFNILCVCIFFPLEMAFHFLETIATFLADVFVNIGGLKLASPLNLATKPFADWCGAFMSGILPYKPWDAVVYAVISLAVLFFALIGLVKVMRKFAEGKFEVLFDKYVGKFPYLALALGIIVTGTIQSSSVVTSLMVPIVGAGILTVEQIYPVTLGANIGTTVTAILAALATNNVLGLTIAFVHSLFNICGTIVFFVIAPLRVVPITIAKYLAALITKAKYYAILFVLVVFFLIPGAIIFLQKLLGGK